MIRDINEQMAELAPSQNIRLGEPVEAGKFQSAMDSPSSATAAAYMTGSGMAQMAGFNMARAMQVEPDRAARASQLAAETNIPQALVLGNMEDVERRKNVRAWSDAATKDRVLAELLRDREFAEVAQDDLEPMSAWSRFRSSVADLNQYREDLWFGTMRGIAEEGQGIASGWRLGRLTAQRGIVGARIAMQGEYAGDRELMEAYSEELRNLARPGTFLGAATELVAQQTVTLPEVAGEAALGATVGGAAGFMGGPFAAITVPGGMALGATAGATTGAARQAFRVEAGNHFADLVQEGVPEDEARQIAIGVGAINAGLEVVGLGIVTAPARAALRSVIREGMSQALRQTTTRAALGTFAKQYGQAIAGEVATEVLQEVTNIAGEELAADIAPEVMESQLATPEGRAALASRLTDTAKHVAMAMVVLGPIAPGANLYTNMRAVAATKKEQRFYEELRANKDASKLAKRAPALYQRAAAAQLRGTDAETTYIRADAMREVLAQAGITAEQAEAVIPNLRQKLEQASVTGGDITIPTADYVAKLMGTKVGDLMQQHVRLTAEAKSLRELAAAQAEREQVIREAEAVMKAKTEADTAFVQSAKDVEDRILAMLKATGRMSAEQAEVNARIVRDFYVVQAAKMGKTPSELYAEFPYAVRGAGMAAPLEQAARIDADYMAAVERGDMETAQRMVDEAARAGRRRGPIVDGIELTDAIGQTPRFPTSIEWITAKKVASLLGDTGRLTIYDQASTGSLYGYITFADGSSHPVRIADHPTPRPSAKTIVAKARKQAVQPKAQEAVTRDEQGNVVPLSRRFDITSPRIFEQAATGPRLMAVHNLSADNLQFAERMGGLAVPSIGVITQEAGGVEGFGEITLLGTREMVEPRTTPVFEADAYSARFPRPEWPKVRVAKADAIVKQIRDAAKQYGDTTIVDKTFDGMVNQPDAERVADEWLRSHAIQALFLRTKGIDVPPVMRKANSLTTLSWDAIDRLRPLYEAVNWNQPWDEVEASAEFVVLQTAYANEMRQTYADVAEEFPAAWLERRMQFDMRAYQRMLRDVQTTEREVVAFGETREALDNALQPYKAEFKTYVDNTIKSQFDAPFLRDGRLKRPYTLGNIVDFMASSKVRGEEKGMTFGAGAARAKRARAFPDLEEMREAAKTAIVNPQEYAKARKESEKTLEAYRLAVVDYTRLTDWRGKQDTWAAMDASMKALARYGKRKKRNAKAMREALSREQFAIASIPAETIEQAIDAADSLFNAPVPYFEAKPQRAVRLDEFAGAVIPTDASQQTRDILERSGIPYMSYMAGNEEDRQRAVRQMARSPEARGDVLFQAPVTPGFYSALEREVNAIDAKALPASGWSERFKGLISKGAIKADELEWSGLADYLKMQEGKVSKDTVLEFLRGNGVRVERVTLQDVKRVEREGPLFYVEGPLDVVGRDAPGWFVRDASGSTEEGPFDSEAEAEQAAQQFAAEAERKELAARPLPTKYEGYTLSGGKNYREVLLTLPTGFQAPIPAVSPEGLAAREAIFAKYAPRLAELEREGNSLMFAGRALTDEEAQRLADVRNERDALEEQRNAEARAAYRIPERPAAPEFTTPHWQQQNVLVHLRMNDRVDADGKRVLFVEEVQSDWGQAGKKKGFLNTALREQRIAELERIKDEAIKDAEPYTSVGQDAPAEILDRWNAAANELNRIRRETDLVPRAPFVETTDGWLNLGLKQVLLEAVRGNYDRVAFVTGQQSADRYNLSKQVSRVYLSNMVFDGETDQLARATIVVTGRNGIDLIKEKQATPARIEELIGKEAAQRLISSPPITYYVAGTPQQVNVLEGDGLKVGGEGMKSFYDKIVPIAMGKLLKKYGGGKIGSVVLPNMKQQELEADAERMGMTQADVLDLAEPGEYAATQPGFPVTPEMVKKLESGLPLFQAAPVSGPRGAFDPARLTTILNEGADASTFLHETAHAFLHMYSIFASAPNGSQSIKDDMDKTLVWFGIAGATAEERLNTWNQMTVDQQRPYHEQFAYNWELYMFEGKAPTADLQGIFERFSAWLRRVYRSIRDELNVIYRREFGRDMPILTGEVAQVMDRMIASEDEIAFQQAVNDMKPHFQTQDESGMSDAEWAAYQQLRAEADEAAVTDLSRASMKQMEWLEGARSEVLRKLQAKHNKLRGDIRREVTELMARDPYYQALSFMRTGKARLPNGAEVTSEGATRLSMAAVRQINDQLPMDRLIDLNRLPNGILAEDGLAPDVVAEMFGFSSGEEMLRSMVDMKPLRDAIRDRVDARMLAYSGLLDPDVQEAEIQKALHNEARKRFVAVENRFISGATQPTKVMIEAAEQVAREVINSRVYRDLRPSDYTAAEARAAGDAAKAYTVRRTPEQVGQSAYTRTYNQQKAAGADDATAEAAATAASANAAAAAQARLEAFRREYGDASPEAVVRRAIQTQMYQGVLAGEAATAKEELATGVRYLRRVLRDENVAKMGAGYADQIRAILSRFDLSPITVAAAQEREALSTWLAGLEKAGIVPDLAPEVLNEALTISYRNMTVEQLRGVIDSVKQLEYVGKNERKVQLAKQRADFEVVKDGIVARIDEVAQTKGRKAKAETATTNLGRANDAIKGFFASHMKAASIVRILDGGEDGGPLWQYLIRTANEAGNREVRMRAEATEGLTKIMQPLLALGPMGGSGVMFPTINRRLNRESRLAIALNTGNAGNIQRLLDGEGWSLDQIMPVLESLTSQEWEAVQAIWDWLERYRPMIAEKERRLYGKEPQWVEPVPFTIRTKDGSVATLRGGYYPIKYDPRSSRLTQAQNEAEEAKRQMQGAYTSATTRRSFTKSRVREVKGRRLLYTMDGLYNGVNEVIHDLTWHEWLISANRLMRSDKFDNAVRSQYGPDWVNELRYWIRDVAVGEGATQAAGEQFLSMVRQNVSATGLGLNIISAAIQVTGVAQSARRVGFKFMGRGIATLMSSPLESGRMVNDRSQFMADRSRTQFRELAELKNIVRGQTTAMRQLRAATYFLLLRVQRVVDLATWIGAYEKAANEGRSDSDAIAIADQTVIDTQGSGLYKDLARIERGGPALKLFTVFYQYMNVVANLTTVQVMTAKSRGQLAADLMMILVVPVLLDQLIRNALRPAADDADEPELDAIAKQLAAAQLEYLMGTIFGVRELAQIARIVTGAEGVRGYEGPAGLRGFGETIRFAQQASQGEFDTAFRRSAVNMLGITMGIPSAQINRTIDGIEALMEGEVEGVAAPLAPLTGVRR